MYCDYLLFFVILFGGGFLAHGIYALVSKERLDDVLQALYSFTGTPIKLIDPGGVQLEQFGKTKYCDVLGKYPPCKNQCVSLQLKASQYGRQSGEAYIFSCPYGLNLIAFPLTGKGMVFGSVILGPFLMDSPDHSMLNTLAEEFSIQTSTLLRAYDALADIQIIPPAKVNDLSKLLFYLLSPLIPSERALLLQAKEKLSQQSRINETIQMYKEQGLTPDQNNYYHLETYLLSKVKTGNVQKAKDILNEVIGYTFFTEGKNIDAIRTRSIELVILLSHIALASDTRAESIFEISSRFLLLISQEKDFENLCYLLQEMVEDYTDIMFHENDMSNYHIRKALQFMAENYAQQLTLEIVAEHVKLSPSYFSTLFRRVTGISFRSWLCQIRVEESKLLLLHTNFPLSDIAIAVGFTDQSYYCKVFKRIVGITPGKYRG